MWLINLAWATIRYCLHPGSDEDIDQRQRDLLDDMDKQARDREEGK